MADPIKANIVYPDLSYQIMNVAYEVHNQLGPGFTEDFYERAFMLELRQRGIPFEQQKAITVSYKGVPLGQYRLDLVIDDKIIVELKAVTQMNEIFFHQVRSYLKATGMQLGILINFGCASVEAKRIANTIEGKSPPEIRHSRNLLNS